MTAAAFPRVCPFSPLFKRKHTYNLYEASSEMSSEKLEQVVRQLEAQLLTQPKNNSLKKAVRKLRKDLLPRL